jgi:glycerol kinase
VAILAIDQGSSATKAVVVGEDGGRLAQASRPVRAQHAAGGVVECDGEEILRSVIDAGRHALGQTNEPLTAIGIGNQGETVLAWDRSSGRPLGPAISWQDKRAHTIAKQLSGHRDRLHQITGLPLDPYFAAPKMRWLREQHPAAGVVTTIDSWIIQRLSGEFVTDAATASRTLLLDLDAGEWSDEAFALFGLSAEERPRIVECAAEIGRTDVFGSSIPLTSAIVDQQAALFGLGCLHPGELKCTYGTGAFAMVNVGPEPRRSSSNLPASIAWTFGGETMYCLDGPVYAVGAALTWLCDLGLLSAAADLDAVASRAGDSDVVFIPALAGSGPPNWSSRPSGAWFGLSLATQKEDLVRAAVSGVAAEVTTLIRLIEKDLEQPITSLRADGGLAASDTLLQTQSDLLQLPVERSATLDATAAGIAALSALGLGSGATIEWVGNATPPARVFEPQISRDEAYDRLTRWQNAATAAIRVGGGNPAH